MHNLDQAMTKARRSLDAAIALYERGDFDFAASRAYYAMFYVAEALLSTLKQSYTSHSAVIGAYGRECSDGLLDSASGPWDNDKRRFISYYTYRPVLFPNMPPGKYRVRVVQELPWQSPRDLNCGQEIEVPAHAKKPVRVTLPAAVCCAKDDD